MGHHELVHPTPVCLPCSNSLGPGTRVLGRGKEDSSAMMDWSAGDLEHSWAGKSLLATVGPQQHTPQRRDFICVRTIQKGITACPPAKSKLSATSGAGCWSPPHRTGIQQQRINKLKTVQAALDGKRLKKGKGCHWDQGGFVGAVLPI